MLDPKQTNFLIYLRDGYCLEGVDGRQITGTRYLAAAEHLDFQAADALCQRLRRRGHRAAIVTDNLGNAVEAASFQNR
jgi:hypothetical protein